jgi:hypothetical protein
MRPLEAGETGMAEDSECREDLKEALKNWTALRILHGQPPQGIGQL